MSEHSCGGHCEGCESAGNCEKESLLEPTGKFNNIKHVIAVISGKGGVGKSMTSSLLAAALRKKGHSVGILDADVTGPSIPKSFGITANAMQDDRGILPAVSKSGIKIMSVNMMLPDKESPVIWRGPVIAGVVKQFWTDVVWGDLDYLIVDCPPGTGDVPLTVFQSIPLDGAVIVTSPQDLVSLIVKKAYNMARMMNINVLGIIENMSYFVCPDCGKKHSIFGEGCDAVAEETGLKVLARMPIDPDLAKLADNGCVENYNGDLLDGAVAAAEELAG